MPIQGLFGGVNASASALGGEALRMTIAAENLAHAGDTSKQADGLPYARQRVHFSTLLDQQGENTGMIASQVVRSPKYTQRYDPGNPDADRTTGMVKEPDIDPILELTDLLVASKAYESNASAAKNLLRMHETALRIGEG